MKIMSSKRLHVTYFCLLIMKEFVIDKDFSFIVDVYEYNNDHFADLNTLEVHSGSATVVKYVDDWALQRMKDCFNITYIDNFSSKGKIRSMPGNNNTINFELLIDMLIRRFPSLIYKFLHLISSKLIQTEK